MTVERVPELVRFYGREAMLLIGGALLIAGDALLERTRAFTAAVAAAGASA
jgi:ribulose-bisphosphate carboxylase large chain